MLIASRYRDAALAYLAYALLYEGYAIYSLYVREDPVTMPQQELFLGVGLLFTLLFPYLIYRGIRWFIRVLALLVGLRALALVALLAGVKLEVFLSGELALLRQMSSSGVYWVALVVTLGTLYLLARAEWDLKPLEIA